jgi:hypothetical protein
MCLEDNGSEYVLNDSVVPPSAWLNIRISYRRQYIGRL